MKADTSKEQVGAAKNGSVMDQWFAKGRPWILLSILALSILLHSIYFFQLKGGPCIVQHRWKETDMGFFDEWARHISAGDWLSREPFHPHHLWHKNVAQAYLKAHPGEAKDLSRKAASSGNGVTAERLLWLKWYRGNRFHQEPLYVYMVAGTYRLFGQDVRWVFAWQMVLGVLGSLLVYFLGRRAFGEAAGVVAAGLYVLCSPILFYELVLLRATLLNFAGLCLVALSLLAAKRMTWYWWVLFGLAGGLALVLKVTFALYLVGTSFFLFFYCRKRQKRFLIPAGAALAGVIIALLPFLARNVEVEAPVLGFSSVGAHAFVFFNAEDTTEDVGPSFSSKHGPDIMGKSKGAFFPAVVETLKTHRGVRSYLHHLWQRFITIWHWYEVPNNANFYYYRVHAWILRVLPFTFLILVPLGIVGLVLAWRHFRDWSPAPIFLFLLIVNGVLPLVVFGNLSRYRFLLLAPMIPFAAWSLVKIFSWIHNRKFFASGAALGAVALLTYGIGRPLPADCPLIRPADYLMVYNFFYAPEAKAALKAGGWLEAAEKLARFLETEPEEVRCLGWAQRAQNSYEALLGRFYGRVRLQYAAMLKRAGRSEEAMAERRRGMELLEAVR